MAWRSQMGRVLVGRSLVGRLWHRSLLGIYTRWLGLELSLSASLKLRAALLAVSAAIADQAARGYRAVPIHGTTPIAARVNREPKLVLRASSLRRMECLRSGNAFSEPQGRASSAMWLGATTPSLLRSSED